LKLLVVTFKEKIIELTNDAGRLKKVEEFCGENLPTLIKIDDGVLYCHEELSLLTIIQPRNSFQILY
jgi:hypothetical protein